MKQRILILLAFVMAAMTSMTFVSCGDDNNLEIEEGTQEGNSNDKSNIERLCHTWKAETKYDGTYEFQFYSSGLIKEKCIYEGEAMYSTSEYSLSGSQLVLYPGIVFTNSCGYNWNDEKNGYIFDLSFSSDGKSMTLKARGESVIFTRID